jgi:hypothetical protein
LTRSTAQRSLKDQNRWQLWLIIAANAVIFYAVAGSNGFAASGVRSLIAGTANLLPVGLTIVITSVVNGLLSANMKARLVFLRWNYALPGHRAFSKYAALDPRIDADGLKVALGHQAPSDEASENRVWYKFYREVEAEPAVQNAHREFLLTRDYTGFAALFFLGFGSAAFFLIQSWKVTLAYCLFLLVQFFFTRQAAATYGARLVCTVLALKAAKLPIAKPKTPHRKSVSQPLK